jgi:ATP-dependent protease Clp ATPase subunit
VGPCSFCGRSGEECEQLIAGPGVFICDRCVAQATRLSASAPGEVWAEGPLGLEERGSEARCSFCGKDTRQGVLLVASELSMPGGKFGQDARICDECLDLCLDILAETSSP